MTKTPVIAIAATRSGAGKTTLTIGIMAALVSRGFRVQPFKCGPDFIDPTLHQLVTGTISYNLDLRMMGSDGCRATFFEKGRQAEVIVIEGVMGLFDGGISSTAAVARLLGLPVFLVVDAQSCAESAVAVANGFADFDPAVAVAGVIFNRIGSERHRHLIEQTVTSHCHAPVMGYMPRDHRFAIPERHLGLYMGQERPLGDGEVDRLASTIEAYLDLDAMLAAATCPLTPPPAVAKRRPGARAKRRLAVAADAAFCFYYPENLELLEQHGFELVEFSPLTDRSLPAAVDMLYFGGGYPEIHAARLSGNRSLMAEVVRCHRQGVPIYGECGGFMYLCAALTDIENRRFPMAGLFPFEVRMNERLRRLGYRQVTLRRECLLGRPGDILHGHEFHYSDIEPPRQGRSPNETEYLYDLDNNSHEGYSSGSAVGSYIHLHFAATPSVCDHLHRFLSSQHQQGSWDACKK